MSALTFYEIITDILGRKSMKVCCALKQLVLKVFVSNINIGLLKEFGFTY